MPSRNTCKEYVPHSFYHAYNRGVEKRIIFHDDQDYRVFLSYLRRHLCVVTEKDNSKRAYRHYESVELNAYCLMPNHFHLLFYIKDDPEQLSKIMQSVCTAYSMYFNKRYDRVGHLFQSRFKAARIIKDPHAQHISRYIHQNPEDYQNWEWSSFANYQSRKILDWLHPERILAMFTGDYAEFMNYYK